MIKTKGPTVENTTGKNIDEILNLKILGAVKDKWRGRTTFIYQSKEHSQEVYTVSFSNDRTKIIVALEPKRDWHLTIHKYPKLYIIE